MTTKRKPPTRSKTPPPPPPPPKETPLIRIAINENDLQRLLNRLVVAGEWDDPLLHRLRMRLAKHRTGYPG